MFVRGAARGVWMPRAESGGVWTTRGLARDLVALALALIATLVAARADERASPPPGASRSPWFVRVGATGVFYHSSGSIDVNDGQLLQGASVTVSNNETIVFDVGYDVTERFAVALLAGAPPKPTITGEGTLAPLGELGQVRFGPVVLSGFYRFQPSASFRPYAGLGAVYLIVFQEFDGAISDLQVHNDWGIVAQAGAEFGRSRRFGAWVDLKRAWLALDADGLLAGSVPFEARVTLDPLIVTAGVAFRFH
jgi:outer membrane protein